MLYGKKVFLEMSQNSQGNTCVRVFLSTVKVVGLQLYSKRDTDTGVGVSCDFFTGHLWATSSVVNLLLSLLICSYIFEFISKFVWFV